MNYIPDKKVLLSDIVTSVKPLREGSNPKMFLKVLSECKNANSNRPSNKPLKRN
ncbi:hypothetical protein HN682_07795 [Candidatus Peregrinibacteria bacterium]|jgi:hypothetical protein|nr:hypothetical protein [Candidatus Peregrinibacteria bacterium]